VHMLTSSARASLAALVLACVLVVTHSAAPAATGAERSDASPAAPRWAWPLAAPFRVVSAYAAPAHEYAPGHRGIDIRPLNGTAVRAPADGLVAFAGRVADRGVVTIDHGDGLVSTLEPVEWAVTAGDLVRRGDVIGHVDAGGHSAPGALHLGARVHGVYVDPLLLLGGIRRAVLLPLG
jgi:murein DD-endopeptidase MepM/ murein hydrolase activator NlpD